VEGDGSSISNKGLGEAGEATSFASFIDRIDWEDPEAVNDFVMSSWSSLKSQTSLLGSTLTKVLDTGDFGKIRATLSDHFESRRESLPEDVEIKHPVALVNIIGMLPPFLNYLLRVSSNALGILDLPPEMLANAVFQIMEDIDPVELGRFINSAAAIVNAFNRGDQVLGWSDSRFKASLTQFGKGLLPHVDGKQLKEAALALGEQGRIIGSVLSEYLFRTPERTAKVARSVKILGNAVLRTTAEASSKISALPGSVVAEMADGLEQDFEARELGRLLDSLAVLLNKLSSENQDLLSEILKKMFSAIETDQLEAAAKTAVLQLGKAALVDPGLSARLKPEAIGGTINTGLAAFNKFSREKAGLVTSGVSHTIAAVDAVELNQAVNNLLAQMVEAAHQNTAFFKTVIKALVGGAFRFMKGSIKKIRPFKRQKMSMGVSQ
jgi:hypothetical protein